MTRLVNLTRHTIRVYDREGTRVLATLPPDGSEPEASSEIVVVDEIRVAGEDGVSIPLVRHDFFDPRNIPDPEDGTLFIVPYHVAQAVLDVGSDRDDLVSPDTSRGSVIRGNSGSILGIRRFRIL